MFDQHMKAIGYVQAGDIDRSDALVDLQLPIPTCDPEDLLVEIEAISVNPVDTKIRKRQDASDGKHPVILGYDAVGTVVATGHAAHDFHVGDQVWYAGSALRPGSNAQYQCVDHRLVAHAPELLSARDAAALPLTSLTAWELLFDRIGAPSLTQPAHGSILIVGGGGGVGSVLNQMALELSNWQVITTSRRPESREWLEELGVEYFIDPAKPWGEQIERFGLPPIRAIAGLTHTPTYFSQMCEVLAPEGAIGVIDDLSGVDLGPLKHKSASVHWEYMFARAQLGEEHRARQGRILSNMAQLVDRGIIQSTATHHLGTINAMNLKRAHRMLESGDTIGKIVLSGF